MALLRRLLDERETRGGRARALLFLTHPGPSLLVTAVTVTAIGLLGRGTTPGSTLAGAALVVLPAQLATGALNDWADADRDAVAKPFKPVARAAVSRRTALAVALAGLTVSMVSAAAWGWRFLLVAILGAGSGVAYDLGLKRTPACVLTWWGGLQAVAMLVTTATGAGGALLTLPLSALMALSLHLSNAMPDIAADRRGGVQTLAVLLGPAWSTVMTVAGLAVAATYVLVVRAPMRLGAPAWGAAALLLAGAVVRAAVARGRAPRALFPLLAGLGAGAAVGWLAALAGDTRL